MNTTHTITTTPSMQLSVRAMSVLNAGLETNSAQYIAHLFLIKNVFARFS